MNKSMEWKTTWAYLPIDYNTIIGEIENLTQKFSCNNNLDGEGLKIKFTNKFGKKTIRCKSIFVGCGNGKLFEVMKNGKSEIELRPGEEYYSDIIELQVTAGSQIHVFMYFEEKTVFESASSTWSAKSWKTTYHKGPISIYNETTAEEGVNYFDYLKLDVHKPTIAIGLSEIKVFTSATVKTIAAFGDSLTHLSHYFDPLLELLCKEYPGKVSVYNCGIGGNRLLHDAAYLPNVPGNGKYHGRAGIQRFEEDIFAAKSPDLVIMVQGGNDLLQPSWFNAWNENIELEDYIAGMSRVIEIVHQHSCKIIIGTITPFRNDDLMVIPKAEKLRKKINQWIRCQQLADGFVDFDNAIRDSKNDEYIKEKYHLGDYLHPSDEGGMKMAENAINEIRKILFDY